MGRDQIIVIEPNGVRRTHRLTTRGLTIGRSSDNGIYVNYDLISRYHAQVTFDGAYYYVVDLGSSNGTYVGQSKLLPNVPELWTPNKQMRIGKVVFQLERVQSPQEQAAEQDFMETRIGQLPEELLMPGKRRNLTLLVLLALLILLGLCTTLGIAIYYLL